jgi:hypothetical protein
MNLSEHPFLRKTKADALLPIALQLSRHFKQKWMVSSR